MKILVINQPPFNRGDESAHKALIRTLLKREPNSEIRVLSKESLMESVRQFSVRDERVTYIYDPVPDALFSKFLSLGMWFGLTFFWLFNSTFLKYLKLYRWADIVVCAPGGICMGGFQDWNHLFHLKLAKWSRRPLAYYGRSFGPFPTNTKPNRRFKKLSFEMLNYFSFISIRDHKTEMLANEIGIRYTKTVDTAFLDNPNVEVPYEIMSVIDGKKYMVFVPNYLKWHFNYKMLDHKSIIDFYCNVIDIIWKKDPEMNILMLPQTFCEDKYEFNDIALFRDIAKQKNDKRIIITANCYSSDIQQMLIKNSQYVIGGRYHSIVFAINQGVPCIALSYEHKMSGLLETLNKQEWCIDFEKTLFSQDAQNKCLQEIGLKIANLTLDPDLKVRAKDIAASCMDSFIATFYGKK